MVRRQVTALCGVLLFRAADSVLHALPDYLREYLQRTDAHRRPARGTRINSTRGAVSGLPALCFPRPLAGRNGHRSLRQLRRSGSHQPHLFLLSQACQPASRPGVSKGEQRAGEQVPHLYRFSHHLRCHHGAGAYPLLVLRDGEDGSGQHRYLRYRNVYGGDGERA